MAIELHKEETIREPSRQLVGELTKEIKENIPQVRIEEIGSTAIPGSVTKGDVDLLVIIEEPDFNYAESCLRGIYEVNEMERIEYFASFKGVRDGLAFGIQLSTPKSASHFGFVRFRDILRKYPNLVEKYNQIKLQGVDLSEDEYRAEKNIFIEQVLQKTSEGAKK